MIGSDLEAIPLEQGVELLLAIVQIPHHKKEQVDRTAKLRWNLRETLVNRRRSKSEHTHRNALGAMRDLAHSAHGERRGGVVRALKPEPFRMRGVVGEGPHRGLRTAMTQARHADALQQRGLRLQVRGEVPNLRRKVTGRHAGDVGREVGRLIRKGINSRDFRRRRGRFAALALLGALRRNGAASRVLGVLRFLFGGLVLRARSRGGLPGRKRRHLGAREAKDVQAKEIVEEGKEDVEAKWVEEVGSRATWGSLYP